MERMGSPTQENYPRNMFGAGRMDSTTRSLMENLLGLLKVRVKRGINLAVRDVRSSDPYVLLSTGNQKMKTRIIRKDINPEWNEDLTLSITDPDQTVSITVFDHDTFSTDDKMGDAEFEIKTFLEALHIQTKGLPNGTRIKIIQPSRSNCLSEESCVVWKGGKVIQDMCLRLRNVECGEIELQLQWVDIVPGSTAL